MMKTETTHRGQGLPLPRLVRPAWMTGSPDCDWTEDSSHENGNYFCKCLPCGADFIGHKRRLVCRKCYMANKAEIDAMSDETREEYFARRDEELREWVKANAKHMDPPTQDSAPTETL